LKVAGLLGIGDGFTLITGFLLEIGFFWPTTSGGVGVGVSSTRISGGVFGTMESDIGPLASISCALVAGTRLKGFAGLRRDEAFGGDEAESGGMFALWEGEPWSDWGDVVILPNGVFP
jgi:hypothetical protein